MCTLGRATVWCRYATGGEGKYGQTPCGMARAARGLGRGLARLVGFLAIDPSPLQIGLAIPAGLLCSEGHAAAPNVHVVTSAIEASSRSGWWAKPSGGRNGAVAPLKQRARCADAPCRSLTETRPASNSRAAHARQAAKKSRRQSGEQKRCGLPPLARTWNSALHHVQSVRSFIV